MPTSKSKSEPQNIPVEKKSSSRAKINRAIRDSAFDEVFMPDQRAFPASEKPQNKKAGKNQPLRVFAYCMLLLALSVLVYCAWRIGSGPTTIAQAPRLQEQTAAESGKTNTAGEATTTESSLGSETADATTKIASSSPVTTTPSSLHKGGLNLVLVAHGFDSQSGFQNSINGLLVELKKITPWDTYSLLNVYSVYTTDSSFCSLDSNQKNPMFTCNDSLNDLLVPLHLPQYKAAVITRTQTDSWANLSHNENSLLALSLGSEPAPTTEHAQVFAYLLGRSLGLANEEAPPKFKSYYPKSGAYLAKVLQYCYSGMDFGQYTDPEFFKKYPDWKVCLTPTKTTK